MSFSQINEEAGEAFQGLIDAVRELQSLVIITSKLAREDAAQRCEERPIQVSVLLNQMERILSSLEGDNSGIFTRWGEAYEAKKIRGNAAFFRNVRRERANEDAAPPTVAHRILRRPKSKARR